MRWRSDGACNSVRTIQINIAAWCYDGRHRGAEHHRGGAHRGKRARGERGLAAIHPGYQLVILCERFGWSLEYAMGLAYRQVIAIMRVLDELDRARGQRDG